MNSTIKDLILQNSNVTSWILKYIRKSGFDIINGLSSEVAILSNYGIDLVFDVGANIGQYAIRTRTLGYQGKIVSFEPIPSVYSELKKQVKKDLHWEVLNLGLGKSENEVIINISENSVFSSLLEPNPLLHQKYDRSKYISKEKIKIITLDSIFDNYYQSGDRVLLKVDVQGYEKQVLEGAKASFKNITAIQLELSFVQHYKDEPLMMEMLDFLNQEGFTLISLKPLSHNLESGQLLQADGTFFRLN